MDAAKVILHLLLGLEPLLAVLHLALELVFLDGLQVMLVNLLRSRKGGKFDFTCLDKPSDTALIPEVRTSEKWLLIGWALLCYLLHSFFTFNKRVDETNEKYQ